MNELVRYIYSKGHRKIAYIYGEKHSAVTRDRLTSFFQTMESFNLNVPDDYLKEGEYLDTRLVAKATRELLNPFKMPEKYSWVSPLPASSLKSTPKL